MKILKKFFIMWLSLSVLTGCGGEKVEHVLPKSTETEVKKPETKVIEKEETVKQRAEEIQRETPSAYVPQTHVEVSDTTYMNGYQPFYGIWCFASKDYNAAVKAADEMVRRGYYANIFITTDWSNLNKEKWYVVSSGVYAYEEDAKAMLWSVQKDYPDAYVKFSGSWQGGYNDFDQGYCEPQNPPFYGIWVSATKDSNGAFDTADEVCSNGFDGQVFITTDWSNLNSERWYVIAAGTYANKADAEAMLSYVKQYYPNAYIKYSGEWQG